MSIENVFKVTEEERNAIIKSLGHSNEEIESFLQILKEWLKKQPHLPQDENETRMKMLLYLNKFSLEKTKRKWDLYYSAKHIVPELFLNREPLNPDMYNLMENMYVMSLPNLSDDLSRIYYVKYPKNATFFNITKYWQILFCVYDLRMMYDPSLSDRFVLDMDNLSLALMVQITPSSIKKAYELIKNAYSDKIKGVHFVNMNPLATNLVTIVNSLLSEKLGKRYYSWHTDRRDLQHTLIFDESAERTHFQQKLKSHFTRNIEVFAHKDYTDLTQHINPRVLPNECGGTAGPLDDIYNEFKKAFRSKNDWLKEIGERKSNESKRIGEPLDTAMFGMCGSFRKLDVD